MARFFLLFLILPFSCAQERAGQTLKYPEIIPAHHSVVHFGTEVVDDFYNLSDLQDTIVQNWFMAQDSLAETYFYNNVLTETYRGRFQELENRYEGDINFIRVNEKGNYFYLRHDGTESRDILFYRESLTSTEVELFDPGLYLTGGRTISYLEPSHDGTKIAIGFDPMENFTSNIIIYDLVAKSILPEEITNINPDFGEIEWLPDSSGFIYLYFPEVEQSDQNYKKRSYSVIHFLGDDPKKRTPIFGRDNSLEIPSDYYPKVKIGSSTDRYIIGYSAKSGDFYDSFIASTEYVINGSPQWKPFFRESDKVYYNQGEIRGPHFIYRRATPNGNEICQVDIELPDFAAPLILASGSKDNPITKFEVTKDHIYYAREKFGVEISLFRIDSSLKELQIEPPFTPGYVSFFGESNLHNNIGMGMDGWTSNFIRYVFDKNGEFQEENLGRTASFPEFDNLVSQQMMVTSHDSVEVPFSLVHRKDIKLDGNNEVFMYVYGAYGESMSPFFSPVYLDWVLQGGILAFPHVRGGGEKGKEWHHQGMKSLKYNSWKDLIACTEFLVENGFTRRGLVSLYTNSAGGITAGMAINERPELFSSFISEVPRLHPFGLESATTASSTSYIEYGTVNDSLEFLGLVRMDPYLNLVPDKRYPASLLMPSNTDDRIPLWDNGKYIAKLQKYNIGGTPVLMDIDYNSGHENLSDANAEITRYARIFSFAKSQMVH